MNPGLEPAQAEDDAVSESSWSRISEDASGDAGHGAPEDPEMIGDAEGETWAAVDAGLLKDWSPDPSAQERATARARFSANYPASGNQPEAAADMAVASGAEEDEASIVLPPGPAPFWEAVLASGNQPEAAEEDEAQEVESSGPEAAEDHDASGSPDLDMQHDEDPHEHRQGVSESNKIPDGSSCSRSRGTLVHGQPQATVRPTGQRILPLSSHGQPQATVQPTGLRIQPLRPAEPEAALPEAASSSNRRWRTAPSGPGTFAPSGPRQPFVPPPAFLLAEPPDEELAEPPVVEPQAEQPDEELAEPPVVEPQAEQPEADEGAEEEFEVVEPDKPLYGVVCNPQNYRICSAALERLGELPLENTESKYGEKLVCILLPQELAPWGAPMDTTERLKVCSNN